MRYLTILLLAFLLTACQTTAPPQDGGPDSSTSSGSGVETSKEKFKYRTPDGQAELTIKVKTPGEKYKLYDSTEKMIATIKVKEDRVKIADENETEVFKIKSKDAQGVEIEDGSGNRLYRIKRQDDGDWKLSDASETELYKVKAKEEGFEVRTPDGATVAKVKGREGQCNFKSEDGEELHRLSGVTNPQAALWMCMDSLNPRARAGLTVFFLELR